MMDWDAIGAVGEILGAIAVFVSLTYLAVQIRQSSKLAESQYHSSSIGALVPFQSWRADDTARASIFRRGLLQFESLTMDERVQLDSSLHYFVLAFKDALEARNRGFLDGATYGAWEGYIGSVVGTPGGSRWWGQARVFYVDAVVAAIDKAAKSFPPYTEAMSLVFLEESERT